MTEYVVRFLAGGVVVSAFAMLGDLLRAPKVLPVCSGQRLPVALTTLGIRVYQHGADYAAYQSSGDGCGSGCAGRSIACVVCHLLVRARLRSFARPLPCYRSSSG